MEFIKFLPQHDPGLGQYFLPHPAELADYLNVVGPKAFLACTVCGGNKTIGTGQNQQTCPICAGTGQQTTLYGCPRALVFEFPNMAQLEMREASIDIHWRCLAWALVGVSSDASGFRVQIDHTHNGKRTSMFNKHGLNSVFLGTAANPFFIKHPKLIEEHDSLMCEVRNLAPAANPVTRMIQAVIWITEYAPASEYQKQIT